MPIYPSLLVAGTHSGVGKTTVTLALMATLKNKGLRVQGFKVGPDYIDPGHHTAATGISSRNLDTWMMGAEACLELFTRTASRADVSVIEGVMGLYDGAVAPPGVSAVAPPGVLAVAPPGVLAVAPPGVLAVAPPGVLAVAPPGPPKAEAVALPNTKGPVPGTVAGSTAHLAKLLGVPVLLVLDARGLGQSAAAMALGYKLLDPEILLAGIVLNNVASEAHLEYLRRPIEEQAGLPVLAYMKRDTALRMPERHLGLTPSQEYKHPNLYGGLAERLVWVSEKGPLEIAVLAREIPPQRPRVFDVGATRRVIPTRLALARDEAFHFYYQDNLELLQSLGAQLLPFSPLRDKTLPSGADLIYIGGGFPELYASQLEANVPMREAIREAAENGVVVYAECGGLMYLMERLIDFEGRTHNMCGVFGGATQMEKKRQALGYVTVRARHDNLLCKGGETLRGHVFHWSRLLDLPKEATFAYELEKGYDTTGCPSVPSPQLGPDGLQKNNVLASYVHIHFAQDPVLAENLLSSAGRVRV